MPSKFIIFLPGDGQSLPPDFRREGTDPPFGAANPMLLVCSPGVPPTAADAHIALIWEPLNAEAFPPDALEPQIREFLESADLCAVACHHGHPQRRKLIERIFRGGPVFDYRYHHNDDDRIYPHFRHAATARSAVDFNSASARLAQSLEPQIRDVGTRLLLRLLPKYLDPTTPIENSAAEADLDDLQAALDRRLSERAASVACTNIENEYKACCEATSAEAVAASYNALKALLITQMLLLEQAHA